MNSNNNNNCNDQRNQECSENSLENESIWSETATDADTDSGFKDDTESIETRSDTDEDVAEGNTWKNHDEAEDAKTNGLDLYKKVRIVDFMHKLDNILCESVTFNLFIFRLNLTQLSQ